MALNIVDFEYYTGTIDEEDLDDVLLAVDDETTLKLRFDEKLGLDEEVAVDNFDQILKYAPKTSEDMVLYKAYAGSTFRKGGKLEDKAYIAATSNLPSGGQESGAAGPVENGGDTESGVTVLAISVPKGTQALYLGEDTWILPRGLTLLLRAAETGPVEAKIQ